MLEKLDCDTAKEVLTIISYCNKSILNKIPQEVYTKLVSLSAESNKDIYIDKSKPLYNQNISEDSLEVFSLIYYNYVAEDYEKNKIVDTWVTNN